MRIKKLHIQNFKSLVDFQLENVPQFCAFVGPNASGKSNIFEALEFTNYLSKYSFEASNFFGDLSDIISYNPLPIDTSMNTDLRFSFVFEDDILIMFELGKSNRLNDKQELKSIGSYYQTKYQGVSFPTILDLKKESERTNFLNEWKSNGGNYQNDYEIFIDNFSRIFVGKSELRKINQSSNRLLIDASNTAQIIYKIFQDEAKKEDFTEWLAILIPEFKSIEVVKSGIDGSYHIFVYEKSHAKPFPITLLSDGTKNILALMAAVYQSNEPQFLCIEEPENGLHPQAIEQLIELFRIKCEEEGHHIWLNTHSQTLVRSLITEEIILVNKVNGETKAKQLTAKDDYGIKTDEAWLTNFYGGGLI